MAEKTLDELLHKPNTSSRYDLRFSDTDGVWLYHEYLKVDARGATLREAAENIQAAMEAARAATWGEDGFKIWKQEQEDKKK